VQRQCTQRQLGKLLNLYVKVLHCIRNNTTILTILPDWLYKPSGF